MFTLLGKAISYVIGTGTETLENNPQLPEFSDSSDGEDEEESKDFCGNVILLNEGESYGLVTGDIYFDFGTIVGDCRLKVGDNVTGRAVRNPQTKSWKAARILRVSGGYWAEELFETIEREDVPISQTVGVVTSCADGTVTVNDNIHVELRDLGLNFEPVEGDMVTIQRLEENGVVRTEMMPLMERTLDAEVTSVKENWGVIRDEIWFSFNVCRNGYRPRRGDSVSVIAIESKQDKNCWRAILVTPKNPLASSPKFLQSPTKNNFMEEFLADKNGIEISMPLDFGILNLRDKKYISVWIKNDSDSEHVLLSCKFQASEKCPFVLGKAKILDNLHSPTADDEAVIILPGETAYVNIFCEAVAVGKVQNLLTFTFEGFAIGRYVNVDVWHQHQRSLMPSAPFQKKDNSKHQYRFSRNGVIVPGEKPPRQTLRCIPTNLPQYPVPERLRNCVVEKGDFLDVATALKENLSPGNYSDYFSALLHLEEIQMTLDMREFDMIEECLQPRGEYLSLVVPGLAEGRPSLLIGDRVYLSVPDSQEIDSPVYEGFIHEVFQEEVLIKFNSAFHSSYTGETYDVAFAFNRTPLRRCHLAVRQMARVDTEVVFPSRLQAKKPQVYIPDGTTSGKKNKKEFKNGCSAICWFNSCLNERQKAAVRNILSGYCRPLPYVIFGPPGTGKTVTLVESILQVFVRVPCSRILVCTPSNSAADLIVERLDESGILNKAHLVRLNAFQRKEESLSECVKSYCLVDDEKHLAVYRRIIVTTCTTAGTLYTLQLQTKHFTHLFVDEAGQATEPECMIALNLVSLGDGQVVLAGDPLQLGPVLQSKLSKFYGLQISLLERLMKRALYARDERMFADHGSYDPFLVTKLVCNYRSHSAILKLSSDLFYRSELIACASRKLTHRFLGSDILPNPDFPLLLHAVPSDNYREANSPSWFNPGEVYVVIRHLQDLYHMGLEPVDIGIITPYRKQVEKIRLLLSSLDLEPCKVGSVEEFQGQERLVIILSTVRSCEELVAFDIGHNIGFLNNPKRFNVAITRAKALLIVVGNPTLLSKDANWNELLKYCCDNGAYVET